MAPNHPKPWILTKTEDYPPNGALSLGQVLLDPANPASALITTSPPMVRNRARTKKTLVEIENTNALKTSFFTWLRVNAPGLARLGLKVGDSEVSSTTTNWKIKTLETETFVASKEYAGEVLALQEVKDNTKWYQARRRVFLVTGVRIARGASQDIGEASSHHNGGGAEGGAREPYTGTGGSAGARYGSASTTSQITKAESISDFVFAYRLHEINYRLILSPPRSYVQGETSAMSPGADSQSGTKDVKGDETAIRDYEVDSVDHEPFDVGSFEEGAYQISGPGFVE